MIDSTPPSSREVQDTLRPVRAVLAALMRSSALSEGDVSAAIEQVTEVASEILSVRRASVWTLPRDASRIECQNLYDAETRSHTKGSVIEAVSAPRYFAALRDARSIAAHDACGDERTSEFAQGYLVPNGITSMLDAPVMVRGEIVGIVCHEHVGPARRWLFWEELVAAMLADYVAMVLGASEHVAQRKELDAYHAHLEDLVEQRTAQLRTAERDLRTMFEAAPVALVLSRASDQLVMSANPEASRMFERRFDGAGTMSTSDFWVDKSEQLRLIAAGKESGRVDGFLTRMRTATGRDIWVDIALRTLQFEGQLCFLVGLHDVTQQQLAQEKLHELATTDALTGAVNRRRFFELAKVELARTDRYGASVSLAMIDADFFKRVNDQHGHAIGDEALRVIARTAQGELRASDVLARVGGEEFVAMLPETSAEEAAIVVERLCRAIEAAPIALPGGGVLHITVSAGVVEWTQGETLDVTLARADAALYAAKAEGRNRVVSRQGGPARPAGT